MDFNSEKKKIIINGTKFKYNTNFSGDPTKDRFGNSDRKGNIIINDEELALSLKDEGIRVRETKPYGDQDPNEFIPEYFVEVKLSYRRKGELKPSKYWPKVFMVNDRTGKVTELFEDTVGLIDDIDVKSVDVSLNPSEWERNGDHGITLWVETMYVVRDTDANPFADKYAQYDEEEEPLPFS